MQVSVDVADGMNVLVTSLAGELVAQLRLSKGANVGRVKHGIECCTGIPESEQRLLEAGDGQALLVDDCRLSSLALDASDALAHGLATLTVRLTLVRVQRRWALSGDALGTLRLWDLEEFTCSQVLENCDAVACLVVDWVSRMAACGTTGGSLRMWDLSRAMCLRDLRAHEGHRIRCVAMSWSRRLALSGAAGDVLLKLWDLDTGQCIQELHSHEGGIASVAAHWPGSLALSGGDDGMLMLWDLDLATCMWRHRAHGVVRSVALDWQVRQALSCGSIDRESFVTNAGDQGRVAWSLRLWDLDAKASRLELPLAQAPGAGPCCLAADLPSLAALTCSLGDTSAKLWDLDAGKCTRELHFPPLLVVALNATARLAVAGGVDGIVWVTDLASDSEPRALEGHVDAVACLALS